MNAPDSGPLAQVTAADVLRWGRAQPADTVIGVCRDMFACLIASYALQVLGVAVEVSPSHDEPGDYRVIGGGEYSASKYFPLPPDLNRLALDFDNLSAAFEEDRRIMHPADLDRLEATP